jgi:hypothetical protein
LVEASARAEAQRITFSRAKSAPVYASARCDPREGPFLRCRQWSGRLRGVVQGEQVRPRARRDRVGSTLVVAELHEQSLVVQQLDDGADLPAGRFAGFHY